MYFIITDDDDDDDAGAALISDVDEFVEPVVLIARTDRSVLLSATE